MSSLTILALTTAYKTKVLSRLVAAYTEELLKMLADEEYKKLSPELQVQAQNELSHWYQKWFHLVPSPHLSSVDQDDFETVDSSKIPVMDYNPSTNSFSYWNSLMKNLTEQPMLNKY
jgi:hypothetical protein